MTTTAMSTRRVERRQRRVRGGPLKTSLLLVLLLVLVGCGSDGDADGSAEQGDEAAATGGDGDDAAAGDADGAGGGGEDPEVIPIAVTLTELPIAVAATEGLFEGFEVEYQLVGFEQKLPIFLSDPDMPFTSLSPIEVGRERINGEDLTFYSSSSGLIFVNGVVIRAEDADEYQTIGDLEGVTLGHPGFSTGTWAAFAALADEVYGLDATSDFELITADPGALLGLLSSGQVDAVLTFADQAATALAVDEFELMTSFADVWEEETGERLTIGGLVARREWLAENEDLARRFAGGIDAALEWMKDNPDEFRPGGKYEDWIDQSGWSRSEEVNDLILQRIQDDDWYMSGESFTQSWIDANYEFAELSLESELEDGQEMPAMDELFYLPNARD